MRGMKWISFLVLATFAILAASGPAQATSVTFTGNDFAKIDGTWRQATAVFTQTGTGFTVTLTNLMTVTPGVNDDKNAVTGGEDLLTGVFFNIAGSNPSLTAITALVPEGSTILNAANSSEWGDWVKHGNGKKAWYEYVDNVYVQDQIAAGNVTGEWAYNGAVNHLFSQPVLGEGPVTVTYGISSTGLDAFGPETVFEGDALHPSVNLDDPEEPDGPNYGIVSGGAGAALVNPGIGSFPLIRNSVTFTLTGVVDVGNIKDVWFQYGTDWTEPDFTIYVGGEPPTVIPEPVTMAGLFLGLCGLAGYVRKRR